MKIKTTVKAGAKATPILERQKGALPLLRDPGLGFKIKSGLKAGGPSKCKGQ
jgi:hypothetical protein